MTSSSSSSSTSSLGKELLLYKLIRVSWKEWRRFLQVDSDYSSVFFTFRWTAIIQIHHQFMIDFLTLLSEFTLALNIYTILATIFWCDRRFSINSDALILSNIILPNRTDSSLFRTFTPINRWLHLLILQVSLLLLLLISIISFLHVTLIIRSIKSPNIFEITVW